MNASGFSNINPTLEPLSKETIEVPKEQSVFQTLDKNNFKDMKLLKSIYDESFDVANEFFSSKVEDDDEGFEGEDDDDDEGFEDDDDEDQIEGMKSKKKKSKKKKGGKSKKKKGKKSKKKKKKHETNFDLIGWAINKAKGTKNDEQMVKNILNSLFVAFLSFLIAHNWYYTFFVNPTNFRLEESLSFLKENEFIHFFTIYIVQIIATIENFIMTNIPEKINTLMSISPFGRRSIFYFIFSFSLGTVPYFLKQIQSIFFYLEKQVVGLIKVIRTRGAIGKFIRDIISKAFNSIFSFKGNPALSPIIGVIYVMKFMENLVIDHSKGIIENATGVIPSFFTKLLAGSIFYVIYMMFKFAIFYQPTVAISSFIITAYLFYFSIVRLPIINGLGSFFSTMSANIHHMNDGRVFFSPELVPGFKTNIENIFKFLMENAHQIVILFVFKSNIKNILSIDSIYLKSAIAIGGIIATIKVLYSISEKYGIGKEESQEFDIEIEKLSEEIKTNLEAPPSKTQSDMFKNIYHPYQNIL